MRKSVELLLGRMVAVFLLLCFQRGEQTPLVLCIQRSREKFLCGEYFQLSLHAAVQEQTDWVELCGQTEPCQVHFEMLLESSLPSFQPEKSLTHINDHAPVFLNEEVILKKSRNWQCWKTRFFFWKVLRIQMEEKQVFSITASARTTVSTSTSAGGVMAEDTVSWCWTALWIRKSRSGFQHHGCGW